MTAVLIVDRSPANQQALRRCLSALPEVKNVLAARSSEEMLSRYAKDRPDLVLLDAQMPGLDGTSALSKLLQLDAGARVLVLTLGESPSVVAEAIAGGALGYLATDASPQEVSAVLATVMRNKALASLPKPRASAKPGLTERELQVLRGMSEGRSNTQIGSDLFLSEDTVKTHARRLFRKLGVCDRSHAVAEGFRLGLLV
ncbi:MAG: response regulator transcription factor [Candidatus Nanopelagicales bacterium]|nr:response regulator transcription factor [Candidatus Nanopelagicales bacterium]MDZ4249889.1 response regulator transcription factor [Candidatus Nanopelagicales bacterium]